MVEQIQNQSFFDLIAPIFSDASFPLVSASDTPGAVQDEEQKLRKYHYEFFSVNSGSSLYKGAGGSLKRHQKRLRDKEQLIEFLDVA